MIARMYLLLQLQKVLHFVSTVFLMILKSVSYYILKENYDTSHNVSDIIIEHLSVQFFRYCYS
jgi:hypothetical protein